MSVVVTCAIVLDLPHAAVDRDTNVSRQQFVFPKEVLLLQLSELGSLNEPADYRSVQLPRLVASLTEAVRGASRGLVHTLAVFGRK